ncbi:NUDIX domain-containing protein [Kitasatospora viridis]|uniref:Nudix hydrolase domain-containing protein n=1 Tax=Kitasatospora viridis TaxID=281105 RepID=A0A561TVX8_9ACTN|nr:NUDIX hydrolase [Kitasatospora viridis]TWF91273.1 hypothetical protein FHX73_12385 [Kitasatospora viridis]
MDKQRVRAVLLTEHNTMLVISRIRPGIPPYQVLVGGGVEDDDADLEAALLREIHEDSIDQALDGAGPLVHARDAGIITFASAPLHGGELLDPMTPELVNLIQPGSAPHVAAFQLIGACPALDVVLTSTSTIRHREDARSALAQPIPDERLRTVLDVLSAG